MGGFRRILCPTDFSPASRAAFRKAVELARWSRGEILLLHVLVPAVPVTGDAYVPPATWEAIEAAARRSAERALASWIARATGLRGRIRPLLLYGQPHDRIVRTARARHVDLVVMGTRGRTGLSRVFLGSVAERVIRTAPCPVLTVRCR